MTKIDYPMITKINKQTLLTDFNPVIVEYVTSLEDKKIEVEKFIKDAPHLYGLLSLFDNKPHYKILISCDSLNVGISAAHKATSCIGNKMLKTDYYNIDFNIDDSEDDFLMYQLCDDLPSNYEENSYPIIWESKFDPSTNYIGETNVSDRGSININSLNYINSDRLILVADGLFPLTTKTIDFIQSYKGKLIVVLPSKTLNENVIDNLIFESDFDYIQVSSPTIEYLENLFRNIATQIGYKICDSLNLNLCLLELKNYRSNRFSEADLLTYLDKAIKSLPPDSKKITELPSFGRKVFNQTKPFEGIIGLEDIKNKIISHIHKFNHLNEMSLAGYGKPHYYKHMAFEGNPGTCKTTMARAASLLYRDHGLVTNGFFEFGRENIVGRYVGETSLKVKRIFDMAKGGVIFIDEIGSLITDGSMDSFGEEALNSIIRHMENNPDTIVIFATYPEEMKKVIDTNPGLQSRISEIISFPDYTSNELINIFKNLALQRGYVLEATMDDILLEYFKSQIGKKNFGNGRDARKLFEASVNHLSLEIAFKDSRPINKMTVSSVKKAITELHERNTISSKRPIGFETNREVF